jgi:hypothetical protein
MSLVVRAAQVSTNDFKNGMTIEFDGAPYKVVGELKGLRAGGTAGLVPLLLLVGLSCPAGSGSPSLSPMAQQLQRIMHPALQ